MGTGGSRSIQTLMEHPDNTWIVHFLGEDFKNKGPKENFRITKTERHVLHDEQGMVDISWS